MKSLHREKDFKSKVHKNAILLPKIQSTPPPNPACQPGRDEPLSKEIYFLQDILVHKPTCTSKLSGTVIGLMDTRADPP